MYKFVSQFEFTTIFGMITFRNTILSFENSVEPDQLAFVETS